MTFEPEHIWCVIPVFNNRDTVKQVAQGCRKLVRHVIVVDDGSKDTDVKKLFSGTDIIVLTHEKNRGKGCAIKTALKFIKTKGGRFMITIDGDGQHYPADIQNFLSKLSDDTIVVGCRRFSGNKNIPGSSRFGRKFANMWLQIETGVYIDDCQSGFRAYPVEYISQIPLHGSYYDFETEVLARAVWKGLRLETVQIDVSYPKPELRVSNFKPLIDNFRISCMHARLTGRRLIPFPHKKLVKKNIKHDYLWLFLHPAQLIKGLLKENASPEGLAMAAAVGTFLATLPLLFVHTLVILYVAACLNLNKVMAVSIQNICMPPFIPMVCVELGYYMRHGEWLTHFSFKIMLDELHARLFEWLLGSLVVAPLLSAIVGIIVFFTARKLIKIPVSYENKFQK